MRKITTALAALLLAGSVLGTASAAQARDTSWGCPTCIHAGR